MRPSIRVALLALVPFAASFAQSDSAATATKKWFVDSLHGPPLPFSVTLDEGTWMSVDVSPDSRSIVFDLLGDIWTLPMSGGDATRITHGAAYDMQPRFSPDGRKIVFVSDRGGNNNVWVMNADGTTPRVLNADKNANYSSPVFTADGQYIVAARTQIMTTSRDQTGVFLYHVNGGTGIRLFANPNAAGMAPSPDGRWIYYTTTAAQESRIERYDRESGSTLPLTSGFGGAARPAVSPDGRFLAFGRRIDADERLVIRDLQSGSERVLDVLLDRHGVNRDGDQLPNLAFTPDGRSVVYSALGKIRRADLASGASSVIPFSARFEQTLTDKVYVTQRVDDGNVSVKMMRWMNRTPDGGKVFFSAAGKNYAYDTRARTVAPFEDGPGLQYAPIVSPDGQCVAYVTWSDADGGGSVFKAPVAGGPAVRLTTVVGLYEQPSWSPDGSKILITQGSGAEQRGGGNVHEDLYYEIRWLDANRAGESHLITAVRPMALRRSRIRPRFDHTGTRVYFLESSDPASLTPDYTDLVSLRLDGTDKRRHLRFTFADEIAPSPDGKWLAFTEQFEAYLVPLPVAGAEPVRVSVNGGILPVYKLSKEGAYALDWADGGRTLTWTWGNTFYALPADIARLANKDPSLTPTATHISLSVPRAAMGTGSVVLTNARLITMGPRGVIEHGDVLVENGRIKAVGDRKNVPRPAGVKVIDVAGKTIMPGMIDIHAHHLEGEVSETFPERDWGYVAQLAYGVTTIRDPSARSQAIFTQAEMVESGRALGPRTFSTGDIIWMQPSPFAVPVRDLDDARQQVRRLKRLGATYIKQYMQPRREQRQWVVEAARAESIMVTPEGGGVTFFDMSTVMDGHTGLEHAVPVAPLYKDMLSLMARQKTYYTPTLIIAYGGANAENWFYQHENVHDNAKVRRFTPHALLDERTRRTTMIPDEEYHFPKVAKTAADLMRMGGNPALGAHGQRQGIGAHWELWAFAMGGMTPMEALRTATTIPAEALGMQGDIGTLEAGKLADLVVLDANPLDNIRNTEKIRYVMKGGVMWNGETMDEVWPKQEPFKGFWWKKYESVGPEPAPVRPVTPSKGSK